MMIMHPHFIFAEPNHQGNVPLEGQLPHLLFETNTTWFLLLVFICRKITFKSFKNPSANEFSTSCDGLDIDFVIPFF